MHSNDDARSILVVSSNENAKKYINEFLGDKLSNNITNAQSGSHARRELLKKSFDSVVINAPLCDEFGNELALYISENEISGIIFIVKNEIYEQTAYELEPYGIAVLPKPLNAHLLYMCYNITMAAYEKLQRINKENEKLEKKIDEIRIVNKAKWTLIEYCSMSEDEAHRYIEKESMNSRQSRRAVCDKILKTYKG